MSMRTFARSHFIKRKQKTPGLSPHAEQRYHKYVHCVSPTAEINLSPMEKLDPQQSLLLTIEKSSNHKNNGLKVNPSDLFMSANDSRVNRGIKRCMSGPTIGEIETQSAQCDEVKVKKGSQSTSSGSKSRERHMTVEMVEQMGTDQGAAVINVVSPSSSLPPPVSSLTSSALLLSKFQHLKRSWETSCGLLANSETIDWSRVNKALYPRQHCSSLIPSPPLLPSIQSRIRNRPMACASLQSSSNQSAKFYKQPHTSSSNLSMDDDMLTSNSLCTSTHDSLTKLISIPAKTSAVQQLSIICAEQDKLKAIFVSEVSCSLFNSVWEAANLLDSALSTRPVSSYSSHFDYEMTVKQLVEYFEKLSVSFRYFC